MNFRVVYIVNPCSLNFKNNSLVVKNEQGETNVPLNDISTILIDNLQVNISAFLLSKISESKIVLIIVDERHLPCGVLLPFSGKVRMMEAYNYQMSLKDDFIGDYKIELIRLEKRLLQSFEDAHKKITKDNASLRNWVGGITKDHLIPINEKLSVLDKINDFQIDKFREESFENKKDYNPLNLGENSVQEVSNNSSEIVSEELENQQAKFKDLYSKYDAQKQAL